MPPSKGLLSSRSAALVSLGILVGLGAASLLNRLSWPDARHPLVGGCQQKLVMQAASSLGGGPGTHRAGAPPAAGPSGAEPPPAGQASCADESAVLAAIAQGRWRVMPDDRSCPPGTSRVCIPQLGHYWAWDEPICGIEELPQQAMAQLLRGKRVVLIGDSHTRYFYVWLQRLIGGIFDRDILEFKNAFFQWDAEWRFNMSDPHNISGPGANMLPPRRLAPDGVPTPPDTVHLQMLFRASIPHLGQTLDALLAANQSAHPAVVIMGSGAWYPDKLKSNITQYTADLEQFEQMLVEHSRMFPGIKFFFTTLPPWVRQMTAQTAWEPLRRFWYLCNDRQPGLRATAVALATVAVLLLSWTAANNTQLCCQAGGAAPGGWLAFKLRTFMANGTALSVGGHTWNVELREQSRNVSLKTLVLDGGDGTYTVAAVPAFKGVYSVTAWLYFSRCAGYEDPPQNATAKFYDALSERDWCFLGERVELGDLTVTVGSDPSQAAALPPLAAADSLVLRVQQHVFATPGNSSTYFRPLSDAQDSAWRTSRNVTSRFIMFGDSSIETGFGLFRYTANASYSEGVLWRFRQKRGYLWPPFPTCWASNPAPVQLGTLRPPSNYADAVAAGPLLPGIAPGHGCDPRLDRLAERVGGIVANLTESDTLFVNIGLHCTVGATFAYYKQLVDEVADILAAAPTKRIVWKTNQPCPGKHFLNEPLRLRFDLYAAAAMRRRKIRVLVVHALPAFPVDDTIHFDPLGSDLQNRVLSWAVC
ncbi:NXPE family member 4 [Micractinium conductrix]|uniref:NXPE family member 4 n=1 Tax=Micractinium conductrix TaxID=554055 RepID=A0A2P6V8Y4_9CHLO|nr:NXPE family member 4 [Micractinium conductrix]|eukprot:PSC70546.1 NXPE family member 4 [Micractinium conductrix]